MTAAAIGLQAAPRLFCLPDSIVGCSVTACIMCLGMQVGIGHAGRGMLVGVVVLC